MYAALKSTVALGTFLLVLCPSDFLACQEDNVKALPDVRHVLAEATSLAAQIENARDRMVVYTRIGQVSWKSGDKAAAKISFANALAIIDTLPRDESFAEDPRDVDRASIATVQAEAGDIEGAQQTLGQIKEASQRSSVLFNVALAQARGGDFSGAVSIARAMQDANNMDQLLEMIANNQAEAGDVAGATKLARSIKTDSYRAEALAYIAAAHKEQGNAEEAAREAQEAVRTANQSETDTGTFSLSGCSSEEPQQPRDAALQRVASIQAFSGDISEALKTVDHIKGISPRENVLADIAEAQAKSVDLSGAQTSVARISRNACKAAALSGVAQALFDSGNLSGAIAVTNTITLPNEKADRLTSFGGQLIKEGRFNSALEILRNAFKASKFIGDDHDRASTLETIAKAQVRAGSPSEAAQTLNEAAPVALAAYQEAKHQHAWGGAFPGFIELETELGDFEGALTNLAHLEDTDRVWVVQNAACARTKTSDTQGALAWASRQASTRDKALALVGVAEGILYLQRTQ